MKKNLCVFFLFFLYCLNIIDGKTEQELCKLCDASGDTSGSEHIYCMFPSPKPADKPGCRQVDTSVTNNAFRQKVLEWHNNFRNKFAVGKWKGKDKDGKEYSQNSDFPRAANMRLLMWDKQLEKLAMRNAQNCYYKQEHCTVVERFSYSQCIGKLTSKTKDSLPKDTQSIWEQWVAEMIKFNKADIPNYGKGHKKDDRSFGHFTAITWAESRVMGCAQVTTFDGQSYLNSIVCNYGPGGNIVGVPMYLSGSPGSKCPEGTTAGYNSTYPNLCGGIDQKDASFHEGSGDEKSNRSSVNLKSDFAILFLLACVGLFFTF